MKRGRLRGMRWLAITLGAWLLAASSTQAQKVVSAYTGNYLASPAAYTSTVTAWGKDCGPEPRTYVDSARPRVNVASVGAQLAVQFPDRRLRSDQCWSPNKAVALTSTTSTNSRWQSECRTATTEPKKESGRYSIQVKGPYTLELSEESSYDWQLNTSRCQAIVRMTQTLERVAEERSASADKPTCTMQTPTRARLRPSEAQLQPGQRACFALIESDAAGCSRTRPAGEVAWELEEPAGAKATLQDGCFRAAQSAAEAEGAFRVLAKAGSLQAQAQVRVAASDLSDITARRGTLAGTPGPKKPTATSADDLTASGVERVTMAREAKPLVWMALAAAAGVFVAGLWFGARAKRRKASVSDAKKKPRTREPPHKRPADKLQNDLHTQTPNGDETRHAMAPEPGALAGAESLICPSCRRGFAPGAISCTADGTPLVAYSQFVRGHQGDVGAASERKCDRCGTLITANAAFCGDCGARVSS